MSFRYGIITSQRDDELFMILIQFSRSHKDFQYSCKNWCIFRPNLIDYISISKLLDNDMSSCRCTCGNSRGWDWAGGGGGGISFSLKNISSLFLLLNTSAEDNLN